MPNYAIITWQSGYAYARLSNWYPKKNVFGHILEPPVMARKVLDFGSRLFMQNA